jgi:hypothetical protein
VANQCDSRSKAGSPWTGAAVLRHNDGKALAHLAVTIEGTRALVEFLEGGAKRLPTYDNGDIKSRAVYVDHDLDQA